MKLGPDEILTLAAARVARTPGFDRREALAPYRLCGIAGGVPVFHEGRPAGGIGVAGPDPDLCESIAAAAVTASGVSISGDR
jgi:uncharacterized protein GlcG (DUF336 family)